MVAARLVEIRIHPVKGAPAVLLDDCLIEPEGLSGDRRKKAAVHIVGSQDADTRANLILDIERTELAQLIGSEVALGGTRLGIARTAGDCAGVYADVLASGRVTVGDALTTIS